MCGLVALITKRQWGFSMKDIDIFNEMLTVDQLRGQDATGAFCVHKNQQVSGIKGAFTPWHLFNTPEYAEFSKKADQSGRILVGHNRHATKGNSKDSNNAHPFQEDNIILVHNGTLYNHKKLADREVDSHAVAAALAAGEYSKVISDVDGAYVFIWYDMERKQLSIVRNKERPLWKLENDDLILFCSEPWMGMGVLRRNNFQIHLGKEPAQFKSHFTMEEVKTDTVYHYETSGKLVGTEEVKKVTASVRPTRTGATTTSGTSASTTAGGTKGTHTGPTNLRGVELARHVLAERVAATRKVIPFPHSAGQFISGQRLLVQINEVSVVDANAPEGKQKFKAKGVSVSPGMPIVDIIGDFPEYVTHDQIAIWQCQPVIATVSIYRETINGGPLCTVKDFRMDTMVQMHPTGFLTQTEWGHVIEDCTCKHCKKKVGEWDNRFTRVKRNYKNSASAELEVICGDCIEQRIENVEIRKDFTEGRLAALSAWEQVQRLVGGSTGGSTVVQGNSTSH